MIVAFTEKKPAVFHAILWEMDSALSLLQGCWVWYYCSLETKAGVSVQGNQLLKPARKQSRRPIRSQDPNQVFEVETNMMSYDDVLSTRRKICAGGLEDKRWCRVTCWFSNTPVRLRPLALMFELSASVYGPLCTGRRVFIKMLWIEVWKQQEIAQRAGSAGSVLSS